mmetsp:Transcript_71890/g.187426  ORF Transcript_71890/g.187426 Transcript_71890/m.187426 type:complete len:170 (+) Transcript_71890:398-907(+)
MIEERARTVGRWCALGSHGEKTVCAEPQTGSAKGAPLFQIHHVIVVRLTGESAHRAHLLTVRTYDSRAMLPESSQNAVVPPQITPLSAAAADGSDAAAVESRTVAAATMSDAAAGAAADTCMKPCAMSTASVQRSISSGSQLTVPSAGWESAPSRIAARGSSRAEAISK